MRRSAAAPLSSCVEAEALAAWADGALPSAEAAAIERHSPIARGASRWSAVFAKTEPVIETALRRAQALADSVGVALPRRRSRRRDLIAMPRTSHAPAPVTELVKLSRRADRAAARRRRAIDTGSGSGTRGRPRARHRLRRRPPTPQRRRHHAICGSLSPSLRGTAGPDDAAAPPPPPPPAPAPSHRRSSPAAGHVTTSDRDDHGGRPAPAPPPVPLELAAAPRMMVAETSRGERVCRRQV